VLDGHPAQAYDWVIQKQVEVELLGQDFVGYFAWHYPPPFLFVASLLAQFPYPVAFIGWLAVSILPYLAVMRVIVGRNFGFLLALGLPVVFSNIFVGQNGFLTAASIGATLYLFAQLQAAIRTAVSGGPNRRRAMARVRCRRRNRGCAGVCLPGSHSAPRAGRPSSIGRRCSRRHS
jgi:Glycosyltransferase family 87